MVEGLPAAALIDAIGLAETSGPLHVDQKRREDFSDYQAERLLGRSQTL